MTASDWVLIFTSLFLGTTALFVPLLAELVKRNVFAPKLHISFELAPPYCIRTYWRAINNPDFRELVYYFRFQVRNNGLSQARLCEAVLEELWIYDASGNPSKLSNFTSVNLRWAGENPQLMDNPQYINVNPQRRVYCDIGHLSSLAHQQREERKIFIDMPGRNGESLRFLLDQLQYPYSQPNCFAPGRYGIKVSIYSENAARQEARFTITWSGKWQETEPEMFRELVIQGVDRFQSVKGT